jgi:hypothetical protein
MTAKMLDQVKTDIQTTPFEFINYKDLENTIDYLESNLYNDLKGQMSKTNYADLAMIVYRRLEVGGKYQAKIDNLAVELSSKGLISPSLVNNELEEALYSLYDQIQRAYKLQEEAKNKIVKYYQVFYGKLPKTKLVVNKEVIIKPPKYMRIEEVVATKKPVYQAVRFNKPTKNHSSIIATIAGIFGFVFTAFWNLIFGFGRKS